MGKAEKSEKPTKAKTSPEMKLPSLRKIPIKASWIVWGVILLVALGFIMRVAIWEHFYLARMEGSERDAVAAEYYDGGNEVDETVPEVNEYHVAANKPRFLSIEDLGIINARIVEVGQKNDGEIDTPHNIYDVGWYNGSGSALPGQSGTVVMDGHGGSMGNGIFNHLPSIRPGAKIVIEMGDEKTKYTYEVVDTVTKNLSEANDYMPVAFSSPKDEQDSLTIITCTGDWIWNKQTYSERLFVRAVLTE